jgi:hypothetical protein
MTGSKLNVTGEVIAVLALVTTAIVSLNLGPKAPIGTLSLLLAIAGFGLAVGGGSVVASVSLLAKGTFDTAIAASSTAPGHLIGVATGVLVLVLGLVLSLATLMKRRKKAPGSRTQMPSVLESSTRLAALLSATAPSLALIFTIWIFAMRPGLKAGSWTDSARTEGVTSKVTLGLFHSVSRAHKVGRP